MKNVGLFAIGVLLASVGTVSAQERVYTLSVTQSELGVIGLALQERPYKEVNGVITSLARQVQTREAAPDAAAKNPKPATPSPEKQEGSNP